MKIGNTKIPDRKQVFRLRLLGGLLSLLLAVAGNPLAAQGAGMVQGRVLDAATGEPMIGVTVFIRAQGIGAQTDINGNYYLMQVPDGTHSVEFMLMGYQPSRASVTIAGGSTETANVALSYKVQDTIVVTAKKIDNTSAALLSKRKKAASAQDAVSAEQIAKSPDSDAQSAVKRITGVTVVGKYIFVRGLSERYTGIELNGSTLPSPEPDKRVVPLDVFPTALLDNLIAVKTYTADLPGEFGGGLLQINSKDYPENTTVKVGLSSHYHSLTTFKDFYTYKGGSLDFLGFDDGTRDLPSKVASQTKSRRLSLANVAYPEGFSKAEIDEMAKSFNKTWVPTTKKGILPFGFNVSYGDSYKFGDNQQLGIITSALFKESSKNRTTTLREYSDTGIYYDYELKESTYETTTGGLAGLTWKPSGNHQFKLTSFYNHQSQDEVQKVQGFNEDIDATLKSSRLQFVETSLLFNQFYGQHFIKGLGETLVKYKAAYSIATRDEPDNRSYVYFKDDNTGKYTLLANEQSLIRYYSDHKDEVYEFRPEIETPFSQWMGLKSKFQYGGIFTYRERGSDTRRFLMRSNNLQLNNPDILTQSIDKIVADSNIDYDDGISLQENTAPTDKYTGTHVIAGGYGQVDLPLTSWLRLIGGARFEKSEMEVITEDFANPDTNVKANINTQDILPGANLIWKLNEDMNLRGAYSRTVARPDFKEMSPFRFITVVGGEEIKGNENLTQTSINNYDLRYEWFPSASEILAVTGFFKQLDKPIEVIQQACAGTCLTFDNAKSATIYGAELELRKGLGFLWSGIEDFGIRSNFSYIQSKIELPSLGFYTNSDRALQGQSPWVVNAGLDWDQEEWGTSMSVLYFMFGPRILRVGTQGFDDTYEQPHGKLDFVASQKMGGGKLKFSAENLLDPEIELKRDGKLIQGYQEGMKFGLSFSYTFGGGEDKPKKDTAEAKTEEDLAKEKARAELEAEKQGEEGATDGETPAEGAPAEEGAAEEGGQ